MVSPSTFLLSELLSHCFVDLFSTLYIHRERYAEFLLHCYFETEMEVPDLFRSQHVWRIFNTFVTDMELFCRHEWAHGVGTLTECVGHNTLLE